MNHNAEDESGSLTSISHYQNKQTYQQSNIEEGKKGLPKKSVSRILKRNSIHYVRSRDELLEEEKAHYEDLRKKIVKTRRTKIVGTMSALYNNYDSLRAMVEAGLNSLMLNLAYCSPDVLLTLRKHRDTLEKEFDIHLPITCVLKGTLIRVGTLDSAEIFLQKGQEYRIVLNPKVQGNNLFCSVDDKEFVKGVHPGTTILIDYGHISLTVKRIEKSNESIKILREQHQFDHEDFPEVGEKKRKVFANTPLNREGSSNDFDNEKGDNKIRSKQNSNYNHEEGTIIPNRSSHWKEHQDEAVNHDHSNFSPIKSHTDNSEERTKSPDCLKEHIENTNSSHLKKSENKFAEKLKKEKHGKRKIYEVIVCEVDNDCLIKSYKPIFIYHKDQMKKQEKLKKAEDMERIGEQILEDEDLFEEVESVTAKDITDINLCVDNDIDGICISNVRTAQDVKEVRSLVGEDSGIKIIAKIQTPEGTIKL